MSIIFYEYFLTAGVRLILNLVDWFFVYPVLIMRPRILDINTKLYFIFYILYIFFLRPLNNVVVEMKTFLNYVITN